MKMNGTASFSILNMTDIFLVLLAAHLTATPRDLPPTHTVERSSKSAQRNPAPGGDAVTVVEVREKGIFLGGDQVAVSELAALIPSHAGPPPPIVEVRVADGIPFKTVDEVVNAVKTIDSVKLRLRRL